jgi:hypothetical protein
MSDTAMNAAEPGRASTGELDASTASALAHTIALHTQLRDGFSIEAARHEARGVRISWLRLATFLAGVVFGITAWSQHSTWLTALAGICFAVFFGAIIAHGRSITAQERALCRRDVHGRHLARLGLGWTRFANKGEAALPRDHAYAWDIDLVGQGSLFQRIDVTHTTDGERTLIAWLSAPSPTEVVLARQAAVWELRDHLEWRQELEAAAGLNPAHKLDPTQVEALARLRSVFAQKPWLLPAARILPVLTLAIYLLGVWHLVPPTAWFFSALLQAGLLVVTGKRVRHTLDVVEAKAPALEAYKAMLLSLEHNQVESPLLRELKQRIAFGSKPPSAHFSRLSFWVGLAELRQNGLFHVIINALTLWDLHVLHGIERFIHDVGARVSEWFAALGELEALASLATLAHGDPDATKPVIADSQAALRAIGLAHPLLQPSERVANDLALRGPGTALVVTGSNMAGKSTLLRALGQNVALALAGGPVIAQEMRVPQMRLRASMRADDSLERGSSYFHAELSKLKRVIDEAEASPPVCFLLDELLRGTNARARHIGAKAVLLHLLDRRATGLCATHDVELAALEQTDSARIENVHFTDVMIDGEMRFDYRLRPGIVRTSNALRLLAMAGIDVPESEREALEGVRPNREVEAPE